LLIALFPGFDRRHRCRQQCVQLSDRPLRYSEQRFFRSASSVLSFVSIAAACTTTLSAEGGKMTI
jgi:hypothetical protein